MYLIVLILMTVTPLVCYSGEIRVMVKDLENEKGYVHFAMYNSAENFPNEKGKFLGLKKRTNEVKNNGINIKNLKSGKYAIAIFHDENSNEKFDSFLGIPIEQYGFSRNPKIFLSPPAFKDSFFELKEGTVTEIMINLR